MARFLFTVWPFTGCVHPQMAVAEALARRGHAIGFYTGTRFQRLVEQQGFTFFPFDRLKEERMHALLLSPDAMGRNWERPWRLRHQIRAFFLDTVPQQLEDLESIMSRWSPAVMITDPAMWAPYMLVSELHHLPVALLSYACGCMLPGPGAPPLGLGLPVPRGPLAAWRNRAIGGAMDLFLSDMRRAASAMRLKYGLSALDGPVIALAGRLPLYLVPSCPEFDYQRGDVPDSVQYVGPLQWYPAEEPQPWLDALPTDRPWVHVTEGTLHVREPFLLRAAALGLADAPVEAILTTGDHRTASDLGVGELAPNVHVASWVSHRDLLPRIKVMVTTGGGGTVMAGIGAGLPLIVVPTEWDKAENAQRVVEAGAGIRLSPRQCTPRRLREAVQEVLANPVYADNARRIAGCLTKRGGAGRAATLLEAVAIGTGRAAVAV